jgi:prepilin-type N-terminal cleavage/methylation domain-containing protein
MITRSDGFSLLELMVVVGVIGVLLLIAIPLYSKYSDSANMGIVNQHYQEAIRMAKREQVKNSTALAIRSTRTAPTTAAEWIAAFGITEVAPGGGPAYVPVMLGDAGTGAVGVDSLSPTSVSIARPAYLDLDPYQAIVENGRVNEARL